MTGIPGRIRRGRERKGPHPAPKEQPSPGRGDAAETQTGSEMKKLVLTTALIALAGTASAQEVQGQSVLERVLNSINATNTNMQPVTGTFANIAENVAVLDSTGNILNEINGSITNTMVGITEATADVGGSVLAMEEVTVDIGDLSTTVLGAVNTGDITLGVNQNVDEALAGSSSAVSATIQQLGGIADQTALVLNVASNATDVIGSVTNSFTSLNGSIGNVATTVLGAVNTGTITSGVNAAVTGVQAGIIGAAAN